MMFSHPQPELLPPKRLPPNPQPQPSLSPLLQKLSRIRIQIIELHPQPDLLLLPQPQFVAVKSLIVCCLQIYFIYGLYYVPWLAIVSGMRDKFLKILGGWVEMGETARKNRWILGLRHGTIRVSY